MKTRIQQQLTQLAKDRNIRVLYACESGSRAWGFPSPDSDYDVRFIYTHPKEAYLSITEPQEHIDLMMDNNLLDFSAWELRKALRLFAQSNVSLYEWMQSPVVYGEQMDFRTQLKALIPHYFDPQKAAFHYLGLTKKTLYSALQGERVKLKKYFYVLRPILAAKWAIKHQTVPPLIFEELLILLEKEPTILAIVRDLLAQKEEALEGELIPPIPILHQFVEKELEACHKEAKALIKSVKKDGEPLDHLFRHFLESM